MMRKKIIQIQGSVSEPIGLVTNKARAAVSNICLGIDDMHLLGNKALVLRAEITPNNLPNLYADLTSIGIKLNGRNLPKVSILQEGIEYSLSIQIVSSSEGTDQKIIIPKVSG